MLRVNSLSDEEIEDGLNQLKGLLEDLIEIAKTLDLEKRLAIYEAHYVLLGQTKKLGESHVIYRYPITALTERIRLVVYRKDGTSFDHPGYAVIDDIDDAYEPIDIETIIEMARHPRLRGSILLIVDNIRIIVETVKTTRQRSAE